MSCFSFVSFIGLGVIGFIVFSIVEGLILSIRSGMIPIANRYGLTDSVLMLCLLVINRIAFLAAELFFFYYCFEFFDTHF